VTVNTPNPPPTQGLTAYYTLDTIGATIADNSGNGNTATNHGATATAGQINGAALFNGSGAYLGQPAASSELTNVGTSGSVTLTAWIKPSTTSGVQSLFMKGQVGTCFNYGMGINGGTLNAANTNNFYSVSGALTANSWQHVAVVYNGSSGATGYVNGVQTGTNSAAVTTNCAPNGWALGS